jgi:hypothetical protein
MYRRSIFTFIDILGFSQIVEKTEDPQKIKDMLELLREEARPESEMAKLMELSFLTFSDSTIRSVPIESEANKKYRDGILWQEINSLVHLQFAMVRHGHFIRGGMTIGDIFIDDTMVYGPAIVKAHTLENEFAVYPRIVIDPLVLTTFESDPLVRAHEIEDEWEFIRAFIRKDSDGLYFIDYLGGIMTELDEEGMEFDWLRDHRRIVTTSAKAFSSLSKIGAKYLWLATYHNNVAKALPDEHYAKYGQKREDYLITNDDMPLLYERD